MAAGLSPARFLGSALTDPSEALMPSDLEIGMLRTNEDRLSRLQTAQQFLHNRLALLYGLAFKDVEIVHRKSATGGEWWHADKAADVVRYGKAGTLPPRKVIENPNNRPFWIMPTTARALLLRDGGEEWIKMGKPL